MEFVEFCAVVGDADAVDDILVFLIIDFGQRFVRFVAGDRIAVPVEDHQVVAVVDAGPVFLNGFTRIDGAETVVPRRYVVKSVFVGAAYADYLAFDHDVRIMEIEAAYVDDRVVADRADVDQPAVVVDVDEAPVVGADGEPTAETDPAFDVVVQFSVLFPHRVFAEKPDAAVGRIIIQVHSAVDTSREDNAPVTPDG